MNLAGWTLYHTPAGGMESTWIFPSETVIPGAGYLIVYALGKDRPASLNTGFLHTNFTLNETDGGSLVLETSTTGAPVVSEIIYGESPDENWSYSISYKERMSPDSKTTTTFTMPQQTEQAGWSKTSTPMQEGYKILWKAFVALFVEDIFDRHGFGTFTVVGSEYPTMDPADPPIVIWGWRPLMTWDFWILEDNVNYSYLLSLLQFPVYHGAWTTYGPQSSKARRQNIYAAECYTKEALLTSLGKGDNDIYVMMGHSYCDALFVYKNSGDDPEYDLVRYSDLVGKFPNGIPKKPRLVIAHSCNSGRLTGLGAPDAEGHRSMTENTLKKFFHANSDVYMGWNNKAHGFHIMLFDKLFWEEMHKGKTVETACRIANTRSWSDKNLVWLYEENEWDNATVILDWYNTNICYQMNLWERI